MSKYIGFSEAEKAKFIAQGGTKVSSKLIFTSESSDSDVTLFDAVNIDWKGYKIGDTELSYSGDIISYITNSYSYILGNMVTSTDLPDFIGEDTKIRTQLSLYKTSNNQTSETPPFVDANNASSLTYFNNGSASNNYWALSKNNSHGDGEYVWMSSYYATFKLNNEFIGWEGPSSDPILLKGEKGDTGKPADYYEIRYGLFSVSGPTSQEMPNITNPGDDDSNNKWYLVPQANNDVNLYTWSTHRHVVCALNNNEIEQHYDGEWSDPVRMTGKNGVSQHIQPVLRYYWYTTNDYSNSPSCATTNENPNSNGVSWLESPGNPHDSYIYLWMIQGQRQNNVAQLIEGTSYWTSPICLSGADGEPGKDGDDLEFIYRIYEGPQNFNDLTLSEYDRPQTWNENDDDDYTGESENGYSQATIKWTDNPTGVSSTYKYEYCSYRRKTGPSGNKQWENFSVPFPWSIYGENGLDGDGVEYIYYVTATADSGSEPTPPAFDLNPSSFQKSEVYGSWHDDPQKLNPNNNQLYQWVSKRNYKTITNNNKSLISNDFTGDSYTMGGYTVNVGDKIWFPYSNPELWNWYIYDGTNAPQIVMIYKRTGSITNYGNMPAANTGDAFSYTIPNVNGWTESPGNNTGDDTAYLWMTTNYYSSKNIENNKSIYHVTDDWQTPVCLTGESGKDGEDGTDIEFIYLRTNEDNEGTVSLPSQPSNYLNPNSPYQQNDWPFDGNYVTNDGVKFINGIYISGGTATTFVNGDPSNELYNVWTDNPLGVTHEYDYEYCAIRKKINGTWEWFCKPFLWSKWGEDGIDGDGVEYIFYLSPDENEVTFGDPASQNPNNNPASWAPSQDPGYVHNDYKYPTHNPGWSDDPRGVSIHNKYEYVSIRHKRLNTTTNEMEWGIYSPPALWARYAEDGRAISLVLESNNDMTSISINSNHIVNDLVETDTVFSLYHNTSLVELSSTSYYKMEIFDSNGDDYVAGWDAQNSYSYLKYNNDILARLKPNSLNSNSYEMHISIPEGFNMTNIDDELRIYSKATILDPSFDINGDVQAGTEKLITTKVKGLQLSLDDIFQIWTDRAVLKNDGEGNYPILTYLQSLTSNTKITTTAEQNENKLFIIADNNNGYKDFVKVGLIEFKNVENSYTFKLYYNESGVPNMSNPGTFLDEETVTLVTESEIYQLVIDPQVINFSNVGINDVINCNVIMYTGNIVTNITNSLNDHNLTIKYRHVPVTGNPGNYTVLSNGSSISVTSLNINISETKGIEFALFKNNALISSSTVVLTKNGADPLLPLTCELLNDNWQIAVSKDKLSVLPDNRQTSYLSIYYGSTNIVDSISNLEITAINNPAFWVEGETINIETPPYSGDNVMIDFNAANAITLSSALESQQNITLQLSFNYQQNHYYKYINLSYTALPQDGENAELYELFIEDDIVKQYVLDDLINYTPNSLSIKIRHVYGGTTEIINPQTVSSTYKIFYKVDNSIWKTTTTGSISIPQVEVEKITIALFNETPNANYTNYIDIETVKVVRDGINGTDSFAEEFIYYCPEGNTEIDWNNISDTTLDPSTWSRSTSPDYIENDAWQDHPTGIDEQHQYEYYAHRTWDKENEIWNNYTSPLIWSMWGVQGKDGDGVEYIYYRNNSETFDGPLPSNWTNDEDFQTVEYISPMGDDYYSYCNDNFTISFSEDSGFAYLFIPNGMRRYDNVTSAATKIYQNITNIQYRESINGGSWSEWIDYDQDNETCDNDVYEAHPDATSVSETLYTEWVNGTDNCSIVKDKNYYNDPFKPSGVGIAVSTGSSTAPTTIYNAIYFKRWIYKYTNKSNLRLQIRCLFNNSTNARFACGSYFGQHSFFMFNDNNHITLSGNIKSLFNVTSFSDVFTNEWPSVTTWHFTRLFGNYNINSFDLTPLGYTIELSYNDNTASITQTRIPQPANNNAIYDTKNLVLSPQEIYQGDYSQLFHKCINLVNGPIIAAKTIGPRACESMFNSCDAITTIVMYVDTVQDTNAFNYCVPTNDGNPTRTIIHYGTYDFSSIPVSPNVLRIRDWNIEKPSQWTDEPSGVSETNKYEWVSTRKYKEVTEDDIELTNAGLDVGDKAWHPYSDPTIWAKYGADGQPGNTIRTALIYKWTSTRTAPDLPADNSISNSWQEHPGNASGNNIYLWMSQGKEINGTFVLWDTDNDPNTRDAYWTAPVCLTGPDGATGSDGETMEFIYKSFDTEQTFTNIIGTDNTSDNPQHWSAVQSSDYLGPSGHKWNDNPEGISLAKQYEYCAIRYKNNDTWTKFDNPFLWSKWGEDGVDGDGIEYIFRLSTTSTTSDTSVLYYALYEYEHFFTEPDIYPIRVNDWSEVAWQDEPVTNVPSGRYQFVSIRKYKNFTDDDYNDFQEIFDNAIELYRGNTSIIDEETIFGKLSDVANILGYIGDDDLEDGRDLILAKLNPLIGKKIWWPYSKASLWSSNIPGSAGASPIITDFSNDQLNFAVSASGKLKSAKQEKTTVLTIYNKNNYTISSLSYNTTYFTQYDGQINTLISGRYGDTSRFKISYVYNNDTIEITVNSGTWERTPQETNGNSITPPTTYYYATSLTIPEGGIETDFTVTLSNNYSYTKTLNICGQHTGEDGENAITYELNPSNNAIVYDASTNIFSPTIITTNVIKYDGTTPYEISSGDFEANNLYVSYQTGSNSAQKYSGPISCLTANNGLPINNNIKLELKYGGSNGTVIDRETIPFVKNGSQGAQGFTGPIVRYRGEYDSGEWYSDGSIRTGDSTSANNYSESNGPRYIDIVIKNGVYYQCKGHVGFSSSTHPSHINSDITVNTGYVGYNDENGNAAPIGTGNWQNYWTDATQFDFVATKLLYADQALINQISTHDLIATDNNGYPVAGITSGSKMYDRNNNPINSVLVTNVDGTVYLNENANNDESNKSNVRMFAGEIYDTAQNSYSLTYAPFNVRQDGTAYMSKANIVGDVNIGGNVNISGTSVKVAGDISAKSLALSRNNTFFYNTPTILPNFNENENRVIYAMYYNSTSSNRVIIPSGSTYLWMATENGIDRTDNAGDNYTVDDKALYTLYSGYGNHPTRVTGNCKYWIMTKSELVVKPQPSGETIVIPPSITYNLSAEQLSNISIRTVTLEKFNLDQQGIAWDTQIAKISLQGFNNANIHIPNTITRTFGQTNQQSHTFTNTKEIYVGITVPGGLKEISSTQGFTSQELSVELINSGTKYDNNGITPASGSNYITLGTTEEKDGGAGGCFYFYYHGYNGINSSEDLTRELKNSLTIDYISIIYEG